MKNFNTINYKESSREDKCNLRVYKGEEVQVITIFTDIQVALVEDKQGKIHEVPLESLQ